MQTELSEYTAECKAKGDRYPIGHCEPRRTAEAQRTVKEAEFELFRETEIEKCLKVIESQRSLGFN